MLAPAAFLASAAVTLPLQEAILSSSLAEVDDKAVSIAKASWLNMSNTIEPLDSLKHIQRAWDTPVTTATYNTLLTACTTAVDQVRLKAMVSPHAGDWLQAPLLTAVGLRLSDEAIRVATGICIGTNICQPCTCICGAAVDATVLHSLARLKSTSRHIRHSQINDIIWRAVKKAKITASKEPIGLLRHDGKRPDGATLVPWTRGRPLAWDMTVPDTFAASHIQFTSSSACAAADKAAVNKTAKYVELTSTHHFVAIAVETSGSWCPQSTDSSRNSDDESPQ